VIELTLEVAFPGDVLPRYYPNGRFGGLAVDGKPPGALGENVLLTVKFERPPRSITVKGQLAWARHRGSVMLKECFGVDFVAEQERLLSFAKAELAPEALRGSPRVLVDLPVRITHSGFTRKEFLVDVSTGGAFVRSVLPLNVGDTLELLVKPPRSLTALKLKGVVAWQRLTGDAQGFGVQFVYDGPKERARLEKLLAKLSALPRA
jgi:uncharacterized protein (TIGR02266 family)